MIRNDVARTHSYSNLNYWISLSWYSPSMHALWLVDVDHSKRYYGDWPVWICCSKYRSHIFHAQASTHLFPLWDNWESKLKLEITYNDRKQVRAEVLVQRILIIILLTRHSFVKRSTYLSHPSRIWLKVKPKLESLVSVTWNTMHASVKGTLQFPSKSLRT